ncbi:MAG: methyl-accepting chemotaxis protein [Reinekea sp.]|nr:methyl-accepting chemotaxis protein [Reinekea sp.]
MWEKIQLKHISVRWRTQLMVLFQVGLTVIGFAILLLGLNFVAELMSQQQRVVDQQQITLAEQTQTFEEQRAELIAQQEAIQQQANALELQKAVFEVYQIYPQFLFWRLASTSSLSDNDTRNGNDAEKNLIAAVEAIQGVDEELADAIDLFLVDLDDFSSNVGKAIEAFRNDDDQRGRSLVSATQNNVISMTSMLEVLLFVTDEVVVDAGTLVNESLASLEASVAAVEASGQAMSQSVQQVSTSNQRTVEEVQSRQRQVILVLVVISVVSVLVGMLLSRSIVNPLYRLKRKIEDIDQQSDLTLQVDDSRHDDIGSIASSVNSMLASFRAMVEEVRTGASVISSETDVQTGNNRQVRDALSNLNVEVDSVATAINEMTATVLGINDITSGAADAANDGTQLCQQSQQQLGQSSERITELNARLADASARLSQLVSQTEKIYAVVDVIQGISEQTNLLALNAAIEAARAGEQGRGFAVVADEVRTLAQRTDQSTAEIKVMVEQFAKEVSTTVEAVENANGSAVSAQQNSDSAFDFIVQLLTSMQNIQQMNEQISQSTQEQTEATAAIDSSVTRISELLAGIAEKASQMSDAMLRLNESTQSLEDKSGQFKC